MFFFVVTFIGEHVNLSSRDSDLDDKKCDNDFLVLLFKMILEMMCLFSVLTFSTCYLPTVQ